MPKESILFTFKIRPSNNEGCQKTSSRRATRKEPLKEQNGAEIRRPTKKTAPTVDRITATQEKWCFSHKHALWGDFLPFLR
jgi:hypothetical protein